MKITGWLSVLNGSSAMLIASATPVFSHEETCNFRGLVSVQRFATAKQIGPLPKKAVLKVQLIEAAIQDVDSPVIVGGNVDVSGHHFPLTFSMKLDCEKLNRTIMPSFNVRVELDDDLLFINDAIHPYAYDETLQKIEVKKIH